MATAEVARSPIVQSNVGVTELCKTLEGLSLSKEPGAPTAHRGGSPDTHLRRRASEEEPEDSFEDCADEDSFAECKEKEEAPEQESEIGAVRRSSFLPAGARGGLPHIQAPLAHVDWTAFQGSLRCGLTTASASASSSATGSPGTLPNDTPSSDAVSDGTSCHRNCWMPPQGTDFLVKGEGFFQDGSRVAASEPLCTLVAVDWLRDKEPMAELASLKGGVVQRVLGCHGEQAPFFLVLNLQVPAAANDHYSLAFYFATPRDSASLVENTLLHRFSHSADDSFRRDRLTLIPAIPEGNWLLRNAVGTERSVVLSQVLDVAFVRGQGFLEMDVNMGTSSLVRGIVSLAISCMSMLTVDLAFLVGAEEGDALPERLFGSVRISNLELASAAVPPRE